jgi:RNA polymerase sigma factor (TIGR02999 family)
MSSMTDVTRILNAMEQGDPTASEKLLPIVYEELQKLARARLSKEKPGQTIQPTMLVHEAYLRLVDIDQAQKWNNRGHFFGAAAEAMRRILVENARRKQSLKRGGHARHLELDPALAAIENPIEDLLDLDQAMTRLEQEWPKNAQLVKLRYFAGLTIPEASKAMGISTATAERYWRFARAWLHSQLKSDDSKGV